MKEQRTKTVKKNRETERHDVRHIKELQIEVEGYKITNWENNLKMKLKNKITRENQKYNRTGKDYQRTMTIKIGEIKTLVKFIYLNTNDKLL